MEHKDLLKQLASLGYPLFGTEDALDANEVLAEVVKSENLRLWEGFAVVLARAAEKGLFKPDLVKEYLKSPSQKVVFSALFHMSLALYQVLGLGLSWNKELFDSLAPKEKEYVAEFVGYLKQNKEFKLGNYSMSPERLKTTFENYYRQEQMPLSELLSLKEEAHLEYALSQVFSPKQRELFFKRLRNEKMTKTEREYFYRVVKKKVLALANQELHELAKRLL